jgi:putative nucleotidyltransferase with HDIG domain
LVLVCGLLGAAFVFFFPKLFLGIDLKVYDYFAKKANVPGSGEKFVVVLITPDTVKELRTLPVPRETHLKLLGKLAGARLAVFDIALPEIAGRDGENDRGSVRSTGENVSRQEVYKSANLKNAEIFIPGPRGPVLRMAREDISGLRADEDSVTRKYPLFWANQDDPIPSLALEIYSLLGRTASNPVPDGDGFVSTLSSGVARLDELYRYKVLPPGEEIPVYEYADVLNDLADPSVFADAVVVVGTSIGSGNQVSMGERDLVPHALFLTRAAQTLFRGWFSVDAGPLWNLLAAFVMAAFGAFAGTLAAGGESGFFKRFYPPALLVLALVLWLFLDRLVFGGAGVFVPPAKPGLAAVLTFSAMVVLRLWFLSGEWKVQRLSLETLLLLDEVGDSAKAMTFPEYLRANWSDISKWSDVKLVSPFSATGDPEFAEALRDSLDPAGLLVDGGEAKLINLKSGQKRLLLPLPELGSKKGMFAILGWKGTISQEIIRSLSALILSTAMWFKAVEETEARKKLFLGLIRMIMGAVDAKDRTTAGHSNRVAELAKELAIKKGLPPDEVDNIYLGGLLHDVGKLGIPDMILNKPGSLSADEYSRMKLHPSIGGKILENIELPAQIVSSVMEHHENLDGTGYPNKLKGDEVSLAGRILKIADVFDALSSRRQYKPAIPEDDVYKIMEAGTGKQFDPELIKLLLENRFSGPGVVRDEGENDQTPIDSPAGLEKKG